MKINPVNDTVNLKNSPVNNTRFIKINPVNVTFVVCIIVKSIINY